MNASLVPVGDDRILTYEPLRRLFDWSAEDLHDLRRPVVADRLRAEVQKAWVVHFGVDCRTFSRAREIRRPSAPRPLRSDAFPAGLPSLRGRQRQTVAESTKEVKRYKRYVTKSPLFYI